MVSVVYVVRTPACEAGSTGSTPVGYPFNDTSVLLGEQSASKTDGQGSNPCTRALPTWPNS